MQTLQRPACGTLPAAAARSRQLQVTCRAQKEPTFFDTVRSKAAAAAAAAVLAAGSVSGAALANELDIMQEPRPSQQHVIDDAGVMNRTTKKGVNDELTRFEIDTGYRLQVVTVRKLEFENDAFGFADKIIEKWYPTAEEGNNKGLLLVVTTAKDGALSGGPKFMRTVGDELVDSIISDNIPILGEEAKFNELVTSSIKRIEAKLTGQPDPGPPAKRDAERVRTYKTKGETAEKKGVTGPIVLTLLFIAVVVPMLQYWGYTSED
jgi:uncharacterized membrane protein YgcG